MTLRELSIAAEACREQQWIHTSEMLANQINCAVKKHVITADRINPYRRAAAAVLQPLHLEDLEGFL